MKNYKSVQHAWYIWFISFVGLIGILFIFFSPTFPADQKITVVPILVFSIVLPLCFSKLVTEVKDDTVLIKFGIGIIHKRIQIVNIEQITFVKNKMWYGWGIRITPHGWLWNIRGKEAVQFKIKGKERFFRLGCADMKGMQKAIKSKM
jgi:hypothetical protein